MVDRLSNDHQMKWVQRYRITIIVMGEYQNCFPMGPKYLSKITYFRGHFTYFLISSIIYSVYF